MKLSTKWLTKGRIELLMEEEEEESLLRRAIAAIAISLSLLEWSVRESVWSLWNAFYLEEESGCEWVGGWCWFVKHIGYMWLESALVFLVSLSLSLSLFTCQVLLPIMWRHNRHPQQPTQYGVVLPSWAWKVGKSLKLNHNPMPHHE